MTTTDTMVRGEHLTAFHDHLDHMLVAHILSREKRIAIEYEDVHAKIIVQDLRKSSGICLRRCRNDWEPGSLLGDLVFFFIDTRQL